LFEFASRKHLVFGVRSRGSLANEVFERINIDRQHDNATDAGPLLHDGNGYVTAAAEMLAAMVTATTMTTMTMAAWAVDDNVGNIKSGKKKNHDKLHSVTKQTTGAVTLVHPNQVHASLPIVWG
jgi:hypothetical protein